MFLVIGALSFAIALDTKGRGMSLWAVSNWILKNAYVLPIFGCLCGTLYQIGYLGCPTDGGQTVFLDF